jgi:HD-like signal output (HDOD) protein
MIPDCHIEAAAKLVQVEPLLAARVVAMSNAAAFNRSGREITDVRSAVMRLGFRAVRSLAMALVTRQMAGQA